MAFYSLNSRRFARAGFLVLLAFVATVGTFLFIKHGLTLARADIDDNTLFVTCKVVVNTTQGWLLVVLSAVSLRAVIHKGRLFIPCYASFLFLVALIPLLLYLWYFTHTYSLKRYAVSGDETSMIFQAEVFSRGMLWNTPPAPEVAPHFKRHHVVTLHDREFSKYPPGFPLLLTVGKLTIGMAWVNMVVSLFIFFLLFVVATRLSGSRATGILTTLFFALTTSTAFHAASYFSHPSMMLLILLTVMVLASGESSCSRIRLFIAGLFIGLMLFFRTFDALLVLFTVGLFLIRELLFPPCKKVPSFLSRLRSFGTSLLFLGGGVAGLGILFAFYQKVYTGEFFTSPYQLYYYGVKLISGDRINEIHAHWRDYFDTGLFGLTPNWLKAQADWTNKYLIWTLPALPLVRLGRFRRFEWFTLFFPIVFIFGYAVHNSGGGDSFGARYYYPVLWCYFYGAAETAQTLARHLGRFRFTRLFSWLPYPLFLFLLFWYWREDFPGKETGIMRGVNKRFATYTHVERRIPPFEKAIVLIKTPAAMDRSFFTRHNLDFSDRVLYGRYFEKENLVTDLKRHFPDRALYVFNWKKETKTVEFLKLEREEDAPREHEKKVEDTRHR